MTVSIFTFFVFRVKMDENGFPFIDTNSKSSNFHFPGNFRCNHFSLHKSNWNRTSSRFLGNFGWKLVHPEFHSWTKDSSNSRVWRRFKLNRWFSHSLARPVGPELKSQNLLLLQSRLFLGLSRERGTFLCPSENSAESFFDSLLHSLTV